MRASLLSRAASAAADDATLSSAWWVEKASGAGRFADDLLRFAGTIAALLGGSNATRSARVDTAAGVPLASSSSSLLSPSLPLSVRRWRYIAIPTALAAERHREFSHPIERSSSLLANLRALAASRRPASAYAFDASAAMNASRDCRSWSKFSNLSYRRPEMAASSSVYSRKPLRSVSQA